MPTTFEQTHGALYKQPSRTVATFPSGLVRIDQSYKCSNAAESTHRETLAVGNELPDDDGYPALDGAFIFPHCQQVRSGEGFTEFIASAYGRTTDQPTNYITTVLTISTDDTSYYNLLTFTADIVLPTGDALTLDALNIDPIMFDPFGFFYLNEYNSVNRIDVTVRNQPSVKAVITSAGTLQLVDDNQPRRRVYTVIFDLFTDAGVALGTTKTVYFAVNDPTIKVVSQTHFGKFTEYKIDVDYNITTGRTQGQAGSFIEV